MLEYKIEHTGITVNDLEKSINWYKNNFGFEEVKRFEKPSLKLRGASLKLGENFLEIICPYDFNSDFANKRTNVIDALSAGGINHLALSVDNIEDSYKKLGESGAELISDLIESRYFFCRDLDGVVLEIKGKK